jgi:hypothetical protein
MEKRDGQLERYDGRYEVPVEVGCGRSSSSKGGRFECKDGEDPEVLQI